MTFRIIITVSILILGGLNLNGQPELYIPQNGEDTISIQSLPTSDIDKGVSFVMPPEIISASDGRYEKYVKVIWQSLPKGFFYKVYRSGNVDFSDEKEISNGWKKSNWLLDTYRLIPDKRYYYRVVAGKTSQDVSAPSPSDKGYIKGNTFALPNGISDTMSQKGAALSFSAEFSYFDDEVIVAKGQELMVPFIVNNASLKLLADKNLLFILASVHSRNTDRHTFEYSLPPIPADSFHRNVMTIKIPDSLKTGVYRLHIATKEQQDDTLLDSRLITVKDK